MILWSYSGLVREAFERGLETEVVIACAQACRTGEGFKHHLSAAMGVRKQRILLIDDEQSFIDLLKVNIGGEEHTFEGTHLLAATGRRPNTGDLELERIGASVEPDDTLVTDDCLETTVPGVYGAGVSR